MPEITLYDFKGSICSQMARLALVEKGVRFTRRSVDIMETNEQFEPWYVDLNPRAVVPTMVIDGEVVTDTIKIVRRVDTLEGPDLSGDDTTERWMKDIMGLHYGVLLYRARLDPDGTAPQIVARGKFLGDLRETRPELSQMLERRMEGNARMQAILKDPDAIEEYVSAAREVMRNMADALSKSTFLAGEDYSLADCFATAAIARFRMHGFEPEWAGTALERYYAQVKARPSFLAAEVIDEGTERDL